MIEACKSIVGSTARPLLGASTSTIDDNSTLCATVAATQAMLDVTLQVALARDKPPRVCEEAAATFVQSMGTEKEVDGNQRKKATTKRTERPHTEDDNDAKRRAVAGDGSNPIPVKPWMSVDNVGAESRKAEEKASNVREETQRQEAEEKKKQEQERNREATMENCLQAALETVLAAHGKAGEVQVFRQWRLIDAIADIVLAEASSRIPLLGMEVKLLKRSDDEASRQALVGRSLAHCYDLELQAGVRQERLAEKGASENGKGRATDHRATLPWVTFECKWSTMHVRASIMAVAYHRDTSRPFVLPLWQMAGHARQVVGPLLHRVVLLASLGHSRLRGESSIVFEEKRQRTVLKVPTSELRSMMAGEKGKEMRSFLEKQKDHEHMAVKCFSGSAVVGSALSSGGTKCFTGSLPRGSWASLAFRLPTVDAFLGGYQSVAESISDDVELLVVPWWDGGHLPSAVGHLLGLVLQLEDMHRRGWVYGDVRFVNAIFMPPGGPIVLKEDGKEKEMDEEEEKEEEEEVEEKDEEKEEEEEKGEDRKKEKALKEEWVQLIDYDMARQAGRYPANYNATVADVERHPDAQRNMAMLPKHDLYAVGSMVATMKPEADRLAEPWARFAEELQNGVTRGEHWPTLLANASVALTCTDSELGDALGQPFPGGGVAVHEFATDH